jgi:hypothetical protein
VQASEKLLLGLRQSAQFRSAQVVELFKRAPSYLTHRTATSVDAFEQFPRVMSAVENVVGGQVYGGPWCPMSGFYVGKVALARTTRH